jgi:hypothetical protein
MAGVTGFEPATLRSTGVCANHCATPPYLHCDPYLGQSSFVTHIRVIDTSTPFCYPVGMINTILGCVIYGWFMTGFMMLLHEQDDFDIGPIKRFFLAPFFILVMPPVELWFILFED